MPVEEPGRGRCRKGPATMKLLQTKDIRAGNRMQIMYQLIQCKEVSRAEIAEITGLNKATVSTIVKELLDNGFIVETAMGVSTGGRKPIMLTQQADAGYCIAVDLNVTHIQVTVTNLANRIRAESSVPVKGESFKQNFQRLCGEIHQLIEKQPPSRYGLIGISAAVRGVVDLDGVIRFIPKLQWRDTDLKTLLHQEFRVPVYVDNDGDLAAMAERRENPGWDEMLVLSVDDVLSAGLVSHGKLVRGYLGFANAVGHHILNCKETRPCSCGKYGCWEQYCSCLTLLEAANRGAERPSGSMEELAERIRAGDIQARQALREFLDYLSIGITNLIFVLNSEVIILNSRLFSALPELVEEVQRRIILPITGLGTQTIYLSKLGQRAALTGAAAVAIEGFYSNCMEQL